MNRTIVQPATVEHGLSVTIPATASASRAVNWRQVSLFLAITFALTYALGLILQLGWGYGDNTATSTLLQLQMLLPAAVAIGLQLFVFKPSPIYRLRGRPRCFFYAYLGYVAIYALGSAAAIARSDWTILSAAAIALPLLFILLLVVLRVASGKVAFRQAGLAGGRWWYYPLFGLFLAGTYALMTALNALFALGHPVDLEALYTSLGVEASGSASLPPILIWLLLGLDSLLLSPILNLAFFFGEEYGWRGYLQSELVKMGKVRGLLLVGVIWGVWHTPIVLMGHNYPGYPLIGSFLMVLYTIVISFLFGFAVLKSGSVWLAAFLHALNNNVIAFLFGTVYRPDNPVLAFGWGALGLLVWGVIVAGLLVFWRRWWRQAGSPATTNVGGNPSYKRT